MKKTVLFLSAFLFAGFVFGQVDFSELSQTNMSTLSDEDGDYSDWLEIRNTSAAPVNIGGYGLTNNPLEPFKWVIPSYDLAPGEHKLIWASGKNRIPVVDHYETVIAANDVWSYIVPTSEPNASWRSPGATGLVGWTTAIGGIGAGDNDDGTTIPSPTSVFLRKTFNINDVSTIHELMLYMDYDDGFVAYINGVEIARATLGTSGVLTPYNTLASGNHEANGYQGLAIDMFEVNLLAYPNLLVNGENVLAIQVHNVATNSSDLTSNAYLAAGVSTSAVQFAPALAWMNLVPPIAWHTNFEMSTGDQMMLSLPSGAPADLVTVPQMNVDYSYNHSGLSWCFSTEPTPAAVNSAVCYSSFLTKPVIDVPAGIYGTGQTVTLSTTSLNAVIRYTLDGSIPVDTSMIYTAPLDIPVTTVVSARAFSTDNSVLPSPTEKNTYVINEAYVGLPVISLSTDYANLYDTNTGIYVLGPPDYNTNYPYFGSNIWEDWERFSYVEYIATDSTQKFEGCIGLKIHGGWSRAQPQKSFRVKCRDEYGFNKINYPLIPDKPNVTEYKNFNLRNGGNDYDGSRMRDAFMQRLTKGTHTDYMGYTPVIVFLNGEYFGEYELREVLNKHWVEGNHGFNSDSVTVITENYLDGLDPNDGNLDNFWPMYNAIANGDPASPTYLETAGSYLDLENFTDYIAAETYYGNGDWSNGYPNNIKFWNFPGEKWRMMLMDLDFGYGLYGPAPTDNFITQAINDPSIHLDAICSRLLQNTEYRNYFIDRYADLINTIWQQNKVSALGNSMINQVAPWIPRHHTRWSGNMNNFNNTMTNMLNWNNSRIGGARNVIQSQFGLAGQVTYTLDVQPAGAGRIHISTIEPSEAEYPWSGVYFKGVPVRITAVPNPGYTFNHWAPNSIFNTDNVNQVLDIDPTGNAAFTAWFEGSPVANILEVTELMVDSENSINGGDWMEIHNLLNVPLDLSSFAVRDSNFLNVFNIPLSTVIPANGYLVVAQDTAVFHAQYPGVTNVIGNLGFSFNNNGEMLQIVNHNGNVVDEINYSTIYPWPLGTNGKGRSLEFEGNGLNPSDPTSWFAGCVAGSPGEAYFPCDSSVVISEINYKSFAGADAGDWFEVHSTLDSDLDISNWVVSDGGITGGYTFPQGTTLAAHGYVVVAEDASLFNAIHPDVTAIQAPMGFVLGGTDDILIFNESGILQFSVSYRSAAPWTTEPNGFGKTLELLSTTDLMNEAYNWFAGCPNGSPSTAYDPTCGVGVEEEGDVLFSVYPNPANTVLNVKCSTQAVVSVFDVTGKMIESKNLKEGYSSVDVSNLNTGMYYVRVMTSAGISNVQAVMVQH